MATRDKKLATVHHQRALHMAFLHDKVVIVRYIQQVIGQSLCAYLSRACVGIK
jgi:hypothetical protein